MRARWKSLHETNEEKNCTRLHWITYIYYEDHIDIKKNWIFYIENASIQLQYTSRFSCTTKKQETQNSSWMTTFLFSAIAAAATSALTFSFFFCFVLFFSTRFLLSFSVIDALQREKQHRKLIERTLGHGIQ